MKSLSAQILCVLGLMFLGGSASADNIPQNVIKEMAVGVNGVYIPSGFTSQTDAYVVVNGLFPNGCYSLIQPKVVHTTDFDHEVYTMAKVKQGICLRVLVPFTKEISVGKLRVGTHMFRFISDDGTAVEKTLDIE